MDFNDYLIQIDLTSLLLCVHMCVLSCKIYLFKTIQKSCFKIINYIIYYLLERLKYIKSSLKIIIIFCISILIARIKVNR